MIEALIAKTLQVENFHLLSLAYHIYLIKRQAFYFLSKSVKRRLNEMGDYSKQAFIEHPVSGVYSGGLWGLEHPPVLPDNHETNLAISSVLV